MQKEKLYNNGKEGIVVEYGLSKTNHIYFSITASIGEVRKGRKYGNGVCRLST